jgi:Tol biopolymer transport system component
MPGLKTIRYLLALLTGMALLITIGAYAQQAAAREGFTQEGFGHGLSALPSIAKTNGKIAFTSTQDGNTEIYVMNSDGSSRTRLTNNPAFDGDPAWSPDGTRIVFTSTRDGNEEIYVMKADGSGQTRLTNNAALDRTPAWSPDGAQIAFASNRDSGDFDIFVMNTDDLVQTNISRIPGGVQADFQDPDWSPDGTKIACSQAIIQNGVRGPYGVLTMNSDGSNQTRLTTAGNVDITPRWSPDGTKIVFASSRVGNLGTFQVYFMTANGGNQTRLTNNTGENSRPAWAPDGTKLTFQSTQRFSFDVYTMNPDGANQVQLTNTFAQESQPIWQPLTNVPFNPMDDPQLFVRRHYLDFLSREPDPSGLAYWVSQITQCDSDQSCFNRKRVDVSAAFFIEQEFQQTGFFIDRFYQAALCRRPTFAEFTADRSSLIVGADLEANKQAFAQQFAQRAEFIQRYPLIITRDGFVDALIATVRNCRGVDLTSQRGTLIGEYNTSTNQTVSRARVLRLVADNSAFMQAEFNAGFVLAEYFGYLRRDPDQPGFEFWLDILNNRVPGNFRSMVCAFITSEEYQKRFGSVVTHSNSECGP